MLSWVVIVQAFHQIVYNASKMTSIVMIYRIYWMQYLISSYLTQCKKYCAFKSYCTECNDISRRLLSSPPQKLQRLEWRNVKVFYNASFNSLYFFNWNLTTRISYHHQPAFPWIFLVAVLDKYSLVFGFQMGQLIFLLFDEGWAFEMWTSSALTSLRTKAFLLLALRCYTVSPLFI